MPLLVDTNVISELSRPRPNKGVLAWAAGVGRPSVSVISIDEVAFGLSFRPNARVQAWFDAFFHEACDVLDVTPPIARLAGSMRGQLARRGRARTQADLLIAATAAHHGLTLVTRNVRDFADCGIVVVDPFA